MKKVIFVLCLTFSLYGCFAITTSQSFKNSISELRYNAFTAEDANFSINYSSGVREDPYQFDLETGKMIDFGVLTAFKINTKLTKHEATYKIMINEKEFSGEFLVNPFDNSFVCDIKKIVTDSDKISVTITADGKTFTYTLTNVLTDADAKSAEAIKIASGVLKNVIKKNTKNGRLNAEVYVRIVTEVKNGSPYTFWVVSLVDSSNGVSAVVISPTTREVVAKNLQE